MSEPRFSTWLGDDWPGPYVVTYELKSGRGGAVVVNGVGNCVEAVEVAEAEFPVPEGEFKALTVAPARVAEASHHLDLLAERRAATAGSNKETPQ